MPAGLMPSSFHRRAISSCIFFLSPAYFSWICFCLGAIPCICVLNRWTRICDHLVTGCSSVRTHTTRKMIASAQSWNTQSWSRCISHSRPPVSHEKVHQPHGPPKLYTTMPSIPVETRRGAWASSFRIPGRDRGPANMPIVRSCDAPGSITIVGAASRTARTMCLGSASRGSSTTRSTALRASRWSDLSAPGAPGSTIGWTATPK